MVTDKIVIPLLRSLITALLVALFAASWFIGAPGWKLFFIVLSGSALVSWLAVIVPKVSTDTLGLLRYRQRQVYPQSTRVEIIATDPSGEFSAGRWADLPIEVARFQHVADRIAAGGSFSHASLAGPGRPLSRSEFEVIRDEFIARGLAYWINPAAHAQGCELTSAGRAVVRHFSKSGNSPIKPLPQLPENMTVLSGLSKQTLAHERTRGGDYKRLN